MKEHAKKALKHDFKVAGKTVPTLALVALFLVGTGSAALLTSFGTVSGDATVTQAVTLDTATGQNTVDFAFAGTQTAGETFVETHTLYNNANVSTTVDFETTCKKDNTEDSSSPATNEDIDWSDKCEGIDTRFVEYYESAGHDFSDYKTSGSFDATVDDSFGDNDENSDGDSDYTSIQAAIDNGPGDRILVKEGTYTGFTVSGQHSVVAENAPNSSSSALVEDSIYVEGSGSTIKGLEVTDTSGGTDSRGIVVKSSSVNVISNYVHDVESKELSVGIFAFGKNLDVSSTEIKNNKVEDIYATDLTVDSRSVGITLTGKGSGDDDVVISDNTIEKVGDADSKLSAGIEVNGGTAQDFTLSYNEISDVEHSGNFQDYPVDMGIYITGYNDGSGYGSETVSYNNLESSGSDNADISLFANPDAKTLDAKENWFGTNGIQVSNSVTADWKTKSDLSLEAGTSDKFGIVNEFSIRLKAGDYSLTSKVLADSQTS